MRVQCNVFIIANGKYFDNFNNMPADLDIFRAITSIRFFNVRCLSKIIPKNFILLASSIIADIIEVICIYNYIYIYVYTFYTKVYTYIGMKILYL